MPHTRCYIMWSSMKHGINFSLDEMFSCICIIFMSTFSSIITILILLCKKKYWNLFIIVQYLRSIKIKTILLQVCSVWFEIPHTKNKSNPSPRECPAHDHELGPPPLHVIEKNQPPLKIKYLNTSMVIMHVVIMKKIENWNL